MGLWTKLFNFLKMKFVDIIKYNQESSEKNGWDPSWFGVDAFDHELIRQVKIFQNQHKLAVDGLVGPTTYRRVMTKRESEDVDC